MPDIVLTTLNARYAHAVFGLRYLMANLGELQPRAALIEFDIKQRVEDVLATILMQEPLIVGLGVYIWNVEPCARLVAQLKQVRPEIVVVLGGPEVSYETDQQEICRQADYVITGEGDLAFVELCRQLLSGRRPLTKIIPAGLPQFLDVKPRPVVAEQTATAGRGFTQTIALPYHLYNDEDIAHRVIYVEASRGCPFKCEFCLSSLDVPVRSVPLDEFLAAMQSLLDRGATLFKFVDRTFNLNINIGRAILQFFLDRYQPGMFFHFEMIPDRLPEALRELIVRFPPGALQFEVGVQTFNEEVAQLISRRQDNARLEENFRFLREHTGVHVHADLIVGLPGEDVESFARGFDRLVGLRPQEIQVGLLKRLRGTPIVRHDETWAMVYSPRPPYEILQTKLIDAATMQRLRRLAQYWDRIANSGNFIGTTPLIWRESSPFWSFLRLSDWLIERSGGRTHGVALQQLAQWVFEFLVADRYDPAELARLMWRDYQRGGRRDRPAFLAPFIGPDDRPARPPVRRPRLARQARHLA